MQKLPGHVFCPDELDMLSEVLNEVVSAAGSDDKIIRKEMAVRLARLLIEQFASGVTDRDKLKSTIHRAAIQTLH
jgi:hypothetical protein